MIRLFLAILSFLSVSVAGLWYSFFGTPIADTAFENEPISAALPEPSPSSVMTLEMPPEAMESVPSIAPETPAAPSLPSVSSEPVSDWTTPPLTDPSQATDLEPAAMSQALAVTNRPIQFGYRTPPSSRSIDAIVLHSSYNASGGDEYDLEKTIGQYEAYGVGAHYIIDRKGVIYRLVDEANIAYHAGASKMPDGRRNVNDFSIGIEMIANMEDGYTEKQYEAVNALIADIKTRHNIKSVVGHGDIAPTRKTDPWKFNWKKLR